MSPEPPPRHPSSWRAAPLAVGLALLVAGCGGPPPGAAEAPPAPAPLEEAIPVLHPIPAFALVADDGSPLTNETLKGTVWVASFLFTSCAAACPAMVSKIQVLQRVFPEGVTLVSISVDPDHDTPEVLSTYASFHHRVPGKWLLATGPWEAISELAEKGFYLAGGERRMHSPRLALVDRAGRLRGYYDSREEEPMTRLIRDVSLVLAEPERAAPPEGATP